MTIWDTITGRKSSTPSSSSATSSGSSSHSEFASPSFDAQDVGGFMTEQTSFDTSQLHPLAGLNQDTLDYLTLDEGALSDLPGSQSALPSRGWSDDLCNGTGTTYLLGLATGGAWGLAEGLRKTPPTASARLRLNATLNAVTRRGPFVGNSAGVIAIVYNGINTLIGVARGKHDAMNSVTAGALSGMLFKSTRGIKPMMISGGLVATAAGLWTGARHAVL